MIAQHSIAPQPVLHPKRAVQHWIILLGRTQIEPDTPQAVEGLQLRLGHMRVVVPEQAAVQGRPVGNHGHQEEQHSVRKILKSNHRQ